MAHFSFEYPFLLLLMVVFILCAKFCKERSRAMYFPHIKTMMMQNTSQVSLFGIFKWIGILSVVIALASPVLTKSYTHSKKEGRDIVLVIDSSDSMRQQGFDANNPYQNKFEVVKEVVSDFIEKRENDRMGMVTFADIAFIASPLTFEKNFLRDITKMQKLGVAGQRTAINDAVVQGYNLVHKSKAKSKIIILLTDGMDNMSKISIDDVKHLLKEQNIKLYTIGIGSPRDYNGAYLQDLADAGGGLAFGARDANALSAVYTEIDRLEATKIDNKKVVQYTYLYIYPLSLALLSLILWFILRHTRGV
jgi:Ca-activated chloride channel family protein